MICDAVPQGSARVLDLACGSGRYSWLLAGAGLEVVGVDVDDAALARAADGGMAAEFIRGDAMAAPLATASFDVVLCVQSLFSLPDATAVLREACRVVRPGGRIVVLESDTMHQLVLPWPPELELAVREAQLADWKQRHPADDADKFYVARFLPALFRDLGLDADITTHTIERSAPLDDDELTFLRLYVADLRKRVWPFLADEYRSAFDQLFGEGFPHNLFAREDLHIVHIETLATAACP